MQPAPKSDGLRKYVWIGLIVVAAGLWMCREALQAWRTGGFVYQLHGPTLDPLSALGLAILVVLFGILAVLAGLRVIKLRSNGGRRW